nr:hypothetical protein [uncultured Cupriavidus sp.]
MTELDAILSNIAVIFSRYRGGIEAHKLCVTHLQSIASNKKLWFQVIERNMMRPGFLAIKSSSVDVHLPILLGYGFSVTMNFFSPTSLVGGDDIAYTTIHHHDDTLLTSVAALGTYPSLIFNRVSADESRLKLKMEYLHRAGNTLFIPEYTPHVVFYPSELTITIAIWSGPTNKSIFEPMPDQLRRVQGLWGHAGKTDDLRVVDDNMYFFSNHQLEFSRFSAIPRSGPAFVQNFFWKLQQIGFDDVRFLMNYLQGLDETERKVVAPFMRKLIQQTPILLSEVGYSRRSESMHPTRAQIMTAIDLP